MHRAQILPAVLLTLASCLSIPLTGCEESSSLAGPDSSAPEADATRVGAGCTLGGANLVRDGGFEQPHLRGDAYDPLGTGDSIGAWLVESGAVDHIVNPFWEPAERRQSIDLDGS